MYVSHKIMAADKAKTGAIWSDDDLDAIVANYFAMLAIEERAAPRLQVLHFQP